MLGNEILHRYQVVEFIRPKLGLMLLIPVETETYPFIKTN